MRKYRNGKASGEPNRDWKYSPEYLAYRQERGGESVKVSQCDVDLDGTRDSIISKWRNPATKKVQDCGPPFLFWPPTNISTFQNPGISSQPTAIQILASPQGDQSPTGISIAVDMDEDGHYAGPDNQPPYDFDDNDPNVGPITPLTTSDSGPTGINISHPPKSANEGPTAISAQANPQGANSGPTGIDIAIDMDEDGAYAGPNNLPPYDFDDSDGSVQVVHPLTSANSGPTGIGLKVDMDEDGFYSDVDTDDLDASIGNIPPLTSSNSGPTGINLKVDMDEDGVYAPDDWNDTDASVQSEPPPANYSVMVEDIISNHPTSATQLSYVTLNGGGYIGSNTASAHDVPLEDSVNVHADIGGLTSLSSFANRVTDNMYFHGWTLYNDTIASYMPCHGHSGYLGYDPYAKVTTVSSDPNQPTDNGERICHSLIRGNYNDDYSAVFMKYTTVSSTESGTVFLESSTPGTIQTAEGTASIMPWNNPNQTATHTNGIPDENVQYPDSMGTTGQRSRVTLTAPQTMTSGGTTYTFQDWVHASGNFNSFPTHLLDFALLEKTESGNTVTFVVDQTGRSIVFWARYA